MGRIRELCRRAGVGPVPTPVLLAAFVACVAFAVWGITRWYVGDVSVVDASVPEATSWESTSTVEEVSDPQEETPTPVPPSLVVHVVGAVVRPGVYEVPEGSRIGDAVRCAGGLTGNAAERAVNLAALVGDGQQVVVPTEDEWSNADMPAAGTPAPAVPGAAAPSGPAPGEQGGPVNVNVADPATLETLPGIGPVTAAKIVEDRQRNGPYQTVEDLLRVSGIGEKKLEAIRDLVTVG